MWAASEHQRSLDRLEPKKYCIEHGHNAKGKDSAKYQAKGDDDSHWEEQRIHWDDKWHQPEYGGDGGH